MSYLSYMTYGTYVTPPKKLVKRQKKLLGFVNPVLINNLAIFKSYNNLFALLRNNYFHKIFNF